MVHDIIPASSIYGPGDRWVLWVQGCTLGCKGCWNVNTWTSKTGSIRSVDSLVEEFEQSQDSIEGITILGGEPLQQAEGTLELIKRAKQLNLTVMLYTGYEEKEYDSIMQECHDLSDLVIGGRYVESLRDPGLRWRGSTNQNIISPTGRYNPDEFEEWEEVEIIIDHDSGQITITGYPDEDFESML